MTIRPFTVAISQAALDDLQDRLLRTRWPAGVDAPDWSRGVPRDVLRELVAYWSSAFDWRRAEARLNTVPQFMTDCDGQPVHFLHARSPEPDARPLLLLHGWPSTPVEFERIVGPLTDPRAHGGAARDAFHLIIPSLPGYGFSNPVRTPGWGNLFVVARAFAGLLRDLGYDRYGVYGTDVGAGIASMLAALEPARVLGTYLTGTVAPMPLGPGLDPARFTGADRDRAERFAAFQRDGIGYLHLQGTRPQTLGYALHDSPVGQLAWVLEKVHAWSDPALPLPRNDQDRDHLLANVCIYWFTGSGAASAQAMYEGIQAWRAMSDADAGAHDTAGEPPAPAPPTAVGVFAADTTIRAVMDPARAVTHWAEFDHGGHFPAVETPESLTNDLRRFFRAVPL